MENSKQREGKEESKPSEEIAADTMLVECVWSGENNTESEGDGEADLIESGRS